MTIIQGAMDLTVQYLVCTVSSFIQGSVLLCTGSWQELIVAGIKLYALNIFEKQIKIRIYATSVNIIDKP